MEKTRIIILGSTGMAGHMLYHNLMNSESAKYELLGISRNRITGFTDIQLDILNIIELVKIIKEFKPNYIINCVGALINESNRDKSNTVLINSFFPLKLSELAIKLNFNLIHLSTDCVFSGLRGNYDEIDYPDANDLYGKSKLVGEMVDFTNTCILRTSIIGPEIRSQNEGLFDWFFRQSGVVYGYKFAFWSGVTTLELTNAIIDVIENKLTGLFHVTNGEKISKSDLLFMIKSIFNLRKVEIEPCIDKRIDKSILPSVQFNFNIKSYKVQIMDLMNYMNLNSKQYARYF
jgi:dTDP-4-dehydrorhamnose reductase